MKPHYYNSAGAIVSVKKEASRVNEFDISSYPAGMYIVKIITNGQVFTEKFIKQ
jgi:hypothetical protein